MDEFDRHGALADAGGNTLRGPMPDIAGDEDARNTRLEIERIAIRRPTGRAPAFAHQMLPGNEVSLRIAFDNPGQPIGSGNGARINEQRIGGHGLLRARLIVLNGNRFAAVRALDREHAGVESYGDILGGANLVFEVLRHGVG